LGSAILNWALQENIGLANFISVGNEADLTSTDFVDALGNDERIGVIGLYVEGVKDGEKFVKVCRRVARKKPIVVLKSGTTEVGVRAVLSHTGSLAGSDTAFTAACRKAGIIRARFWKSFSILSGDLAPSLLLWGKVSWFLQMEAAPVY